MDFLVEFLMELVLEVGVEASHEKSFPKWVRILAITVVTLLFGGLAVLFILIAADMDETMPVRVFIGAIALLMGGFLVRLWMKFFRAFSERKAELEFKDKENNYFVKEE